MSSDFNQQTQQYKNYIENYLQERCFRYKDQPQTMIFDAMRYSLLAGGKRIRPIFTLDFCKMCGGNWENAISFAAAVEMIQTYSLIHDDLPCMDNDDFRRGKPTNHKVYGEAIAVLAGDALLTSAFRFLSEAPCSPQARVEAVRLLSLHSGELGMVGGQVLDIQSETRQCTPQDVLDIQSRKTGALIRAACVLGVVAAEGSQEQMDAADEFAKHLGLAFQIRDDMLDVIGNAEEMGKSVGTDANKNTFVHIYGIDKCDVMVKEHTDMAINALSVFQDNAYMAELARSLTGRTN